MHDGWQLPLAAPATELRDAVLAAGTLTVCAQCAGRRSLTEADLVPGVVIRGAASFVEEVMAEGTMRESSSKTLLIRYCS